MLAILIVIIVGFALSFAFFIAGPMPGMPGMRGFYYRPFFFPFGLLFGIFLLFIIFGVLRWVFMPWGWGWGYRRRYWRYRDQSYYILRERYARGEITKEQYQQMMQDLQKQPNP